MKRIILSLAFLLAGFTVWCQNDPHYIEVVGSAELEVVPNIIILSVSLREYEVNKQKVTLEQIEKKFFAAIEKSGIDKKNVSLANVHAGSLNPRRKVRELFAQKAYSVTFSKPEQLNDFLASLDEVKPETVFIEKLSHKEMEKLRLDVKVAALKAAERKADALAEAVHVKRGKPLWIQEGQDQDQQAWQPQNSFSNVSVGYRLRKGYDEDNSIDDIPFKNIKLQFSITARFQIE